MQVKGAACKGPFIFLEHGGAGGIWGGGGEHEKKMALKGGGYQKKLSERGGGHQQ